MTGRAVPGCRFQVSARPGLSRQRPLRSSWPAFPPYTVRVRWDRGEPRFEARARDDRYPGCLISPYAEEILGR